MTIGLFIPEFPGQTHSFFWREMQSLQDKHGAPCRIVSTRLPARKVTHDWVSQVEADYLFPVAPRHMPAVLGGLAAALPRLLGDAQIRALLLGHPKLFAMAAMAVRLGQVCRARGITHLHVHSCANAALVAALCHRITGLPYSLVLHGPLHDYGPHQAYKWRDAEFVFVITEKLRAEMAQALPWAQAKMQIVPMGVDTDAFIPKIGSDMAQDKPFRWVCCARLNRVKGFDTLLEALDLVRQNQPNLDWQLHIAGEDEQGGAGYRQEVEADIVARGLGDRVTLLGAITQADVLAELQEADGFVLASRHEPLGVAYMEAMSCGLPTIGTDAGGVRELITHGEDGLLVPPSDAPALAATLEQVMRDAALRAHLAEKGRERIVSHFGASRSADALISRLGGG